MSKPVIAIDMDDVLVDSTTYWHAEINRRTGSQLSLDEYFLPGSYENYYENVWRKHEIHHLISTDELDDQMVTDQSALGPYDDARSVLEYLSKKYLLVIVTARSNTQERASKKWLELYFPSIFNSVIFADGPAGLYKKNKGEICKEIGASWLIDDNPEHCRRAIDNGVEAILFGEYGWHQNIPDAAIRCRNWHAVQEYFDGLA